ncbi:MAG: TIGR00296 family protein [Thermoplasmata archaeon]
MLSDEEGALAVRLARASLGRALGQPRTEARPASAGLPADLPPVFAEPRGTFVTLRRHPGGSLRGCIGYPLPVLPLGRAVSEAAVSAATEDPRFSPVRAAELGALTVEVSVLTVPVPLRVERPDDLLAQVRVGRDGLIADGYGTSGLLLPQVAPEQDWSVEELLEGTCEKAGLPGRAWRDPKVRFRRFEAEVFAEATPGGAIARARG